MKHEFMKYEKVGDAYLCIAITKGFVGVILFGHSLTIYGRR